MCPRGSGGKERDRPLGEGRPAEGGGRLYRLVRMKASVYLMPKCTDSRAAFHLVRVLKADVRQKALDSKETWVQVPASPPFQKSRKCICLLLSL